MDMRTSRNRENKLCLQQHRTRQPVQETAKQMVGRLRESILCPP